ncbi:MAG: asparaginase [Phycisphaerae bacterium]|nr:asparaginase [Phycisphaerae bacterium]
MSDGHRMEGHLNLLLVTTGGTIEKTYDATAGRLQNVQEVIDQMLEQLSIPSMDVSRIRLMNKDSLHMTQEDHEAIVSTVMDRHRDHDAIVIVHGTDRLAQTGELIHQAFEPDGPSCPVILTGAMRPWELRRSDAMQNLTESLIGSRLLSPGVWAVLHNKALRFPGVTKDASEGTFTASPVRSK